MKMSQKKMSERAKSAVARARIAVACGGYNKNLTWEFASLYLETRCRWDKTVAEAAVVEHCKPEELP